MVASRFVATMLAVIAMAVAACAAPSQSDSADALSMLTDRAAGAPTCPCVCVPVADFKPASCAAPCKALPCPTETGAKGTTCCSVSDSIDVSRSVEHSEDSHGDAKSPVTDDDGTPSVKIADDDGAPSVKTSGGAGTAVSAVARPWRRICYYRWIVRCYCRYIRIGSRVLRICRCYRLRIRYCRWVYSRS